MWVVRLLGIGALVVAVLIGLNLALTGCRTVSGGLSDNPATRAAGRGA